MKLPACCQVHGLLCAAAMQQPGRSGASAGRGAHSASRVATSMKLAGCSSHSMTYCSRRSRPQHAGSQGGGEGQAALRGAHDVRCCRPCMTSFPSMCLAGAATIVHTDPGDEGCRAPPERAARRASSHGSVCTMVAAPARQLLGKDLMHGRQQRTAWEGCLALLVAGICLGGSRPSMRARAGTEIAGALLALTTGCTAGASSPDLHVGCHSQQQPSLVSPLPGCTPSFLPAPVHAAPRHSSCVLASSIVTEACLGLAWCRRDATCTSCSEGPGLHVTAWLLRATMATLCPTQRWRLAHLSCW